MKKKLFYLIVLIVVGVFLMFLDNSFSKDMPIINHDDLEIFLETSDDLSSRIVEHIDLIDDTLIPIASYNESTILSNNY